MTWFRDNGLTIVLLAASALTIAAMAVTGWAAFNDELTEHGLRAIGVLAYLTTGNFVSALFENWESEFLQMGFYVVLTAYLFQRGSAESRDPDGGEEEDERSEPIGNAHRLGPFGAWLYSYSLGLALVALFLISFALHLFGSFRAAVAEAQLHHQPAPTLFIYLWDPRFWFESFQNWQSEFLSTAVLVVLSIFLRFHKSPESKPVNAANSDTGS